MNLCAVHVPHLLTLAVAAAAAEGSDASEALFSAIN